MKIYSKKDIITVALEAEVEKGPLTVMATAEKEVGCQTLLVEIILFDPEDIRGIICDTTMLNDLDFTEDALTTYTLRVLEEKGDKFADKFYKLTTTPEITLDHDTEVEDEIQTDTLTATVPFTAIGTC